MTSDPSEKILQNENIDKQVIREIFKAISDDDFDRMLELFHPEVELEWYQIALGEIINVTGVSENIDMIKSTSGKSDVMIEINSIYGKESPYTVIYDMVVRNWHFDATTSIPNRSGTMPKDSKFRYFKLIWMKDGKIKKWMQESDRFAFLKSMGFASFELGDVDRQRSYVELLKSHGFIPKSQAVDNYIELINAQITRGK